MDVTLHLPDNIGSLSPVAQLDTVMSAAVAVLLKMASDGTAASKASAAIALGVVAPFGVDNYGRPFKDKAEADAYAAADAQRTANLSAGGPDQTQLLPGAFDMRTIADDDASVRFLAAFYNDLVPPSAVGPVHFVQGLSHWMNNFSDNGVAAPGFPTTAAWTVDDVLAIRGGQWDFGYRGPLRAVLAKVRGVADI